MINQILGIKKRGDGYSKSVGLGVAMLCLGVILLSSCSNTKYLTGNQTLLTRNTLDLNGEDLNHSTRELIKSNLHSSSIIKQKPNTKFLSVLRLKLWLYNKKYNDQKTGKLWNWFLIDENMEPPVIYDSSLAEQTTTNIVSFLHNQGYFYATADYLAKTRNRKTKVTYQVNTGHVFMIDSIGYKVSDSAIKSAMLDAEKKSFIKKNTPFKVSNLVKERERLTKVVRDAGYFHFSNANIRFVLDTVDKSIFGNIFDSFTGLVNSSTDKKDEHPKIGLTIDVVKHADSSLMHPYYIRNIYVYPDYSAYAVPEDSSYDEQIYEGLEIRSLSNIIRPRVLRAAIRLHENDLYSETERKRTLRRLNNLGVWKFVNVEVDTVGRQSDSLDCFVFLIPAKKQQFGANIQTTTSSGDYIVGGALSLNYKHRNTNRAANQLDLNLKGGVEWNSRQNGGMYVQAKELSGNVQVSFPRFIVPFFKLRDVASFTHPQTNVSLGFNNLERLNFFSWASFKGSFGYSWNETPLKQWVVNPIFFNYNNIYNISPGFRAQLENNPFLKNSFSSVFIEGENASFIFNDQKSGNQPDVNYLRVNFEESGLLLNGVNGIAKGVFNQNSFLGKFAEVNYSNYVKLSAEYKHYFNREHSTLVTRIFGGVGIPYGKSDVLPYIKQFTAGGPNSMRAWRLRSLGPGSYYDPDMNDPDVFPDQTGEMKLEANVEYRFDMFSMFDGFLSLKGAVFIDAGNIWNLHKDPYKPGAEFELNRFYQDIAIGSGVGLRLDFSYAILRLDVATPLKVPYISKNYGWDLGSIKPLSSEWRKQNLILNFAVGYPF